MLLLQRADLSLQRAHGIDGLVDLVQQALAFRSGVLEFAHNPRDQHLFARDQPAGVARGGGLDLGGRCGLLLFEHHNSLLVLDQRVGAGHGRLDAGQHHLLGEFLIVEDHHLFNVAHAALQVLAQRGNLANYDGRTRDGLEHAHLPALDALGNLDFALAR